MISFSRGWLCIPVFKSWCPGKAFLEYRTIHILSNSGQFGLHGTHLIKTDFYQGCIVHCKEIWIVVFPDKELRGLSHNFLIHVCLWAIYIFPRSAHLFSYSRTGRDRSEEYINCTWRHECKNWDCSRAVPFLGIFVSNFRYCVFCSVRDTVLLSLWLEHLIYVLNGVANFI